MAVPVPAQGHKMLYKALLASVLLHLAVGVVFTVRTIDMPLAAEKVELRMLSMEEGWNDPAVSTDPGSSMKAISYVEILRKTAAPKLALYRTRYQWEDDIDAVMQAQSALNAWQFRKEQPDYGKLFWHVSERLWQELPALRYQDMESELQSGSNDACGLRITGAVAGRTLLNRSVIEQQMRTVAVRLPYPVRLRISVDEDGSVQHCLNENSINDAQLQQALVRLARGLHFAPEEDKTKLEWGGVVFLPQAEGVPAANAEIDES